MPKILIKEFDGTAAGTSINYANYAVAIAGFTSKTPSDSDKIRADANGIYEFSSAGDFESIIGLVAPEKTLTSGAGDKTIYHYGNQMAYELLKLGYSIVYKPITSINDLGEETFWEPLRDKSSYDFRFITHGLLRSNDLTTDSTAIALTNRLAELKTAKEWLEKQFNVTIDSETDTRTEAITAVENAYTELISAEDPKLKHPGFYIRNAAGELTDTYYETAVQAFNGVEIELYGSDEAGIEGLEKTYEDYTAEIVTASLIENANGCIADIAKYTSDDATSDLPGRGDCIALIELDERAYVNENSPKKPEILIVDAINEVNCITSSNGRFCAITVPSVYYNMVDNSNFGNNKKFPGAFHYLACFINSLGAGFREWYAAAGYTRGVSSYTIDRTSVKLGEIAINALEPRYLVDDENKSQPKFACNVIAYFRGSYYLWGNRTAHLLGKENTEKGDLTASSFLNIRQLCCTIKKQLYAACRAFTFDPNSDTLWINFVNAIRPTLETMKADQGIRDYRIIKEQTPTKATLRAKIRIIPIEAVEDFDLEVRLEDSFGEAMVVTE